jgi:hypothetical protein
MRFVCRICHKDRKTMSHERKEAEICLQCETNKVPDNQPSLFVDSIENKLPSEFKVRKCIGHPESWQVSHKDLKWHCDPEKGIYREAKTGETKEEAIKNMIEYLKEIKN